MLVAISFMVLDLITSELTGNFGLRKEFPCTELRSWYNAYLTASVSGSSNQELTGRAVYESEQAERIFMENTSKELSIYDPQGSALPLGIVLPSDATTSAISSLSTTEEKMLERYETKEPASNVISLTPWMGLLALKRH
jgi:hypothetical protein